MDQAVDIVNLAAYEETNIWIKHFKRSFLTCKNALPIFVVDAPEKAPPELKRNLTLILLKTKRISDAKSSLMFTPEIQRKLFNRYSVVEVKPEWGALKKTLELCETEEMKTIAKSVMMNSGLKPQQLKRQLNLNINSTRKSITNGTIKNST